MDLTENCPVECRDQIKTFGLYWRFKSVKEDTIMFQSLKFCPTKLLLDEILRGIVSKILVTVSCFLWTMLNKEGYLSFSGWLPNHLSSQNLIWEPFPTLKDPTFKNWSFTFMSPFQNCESVAFFVTSPKVLFLRYLFLNSDCQIPSSLYSLNNHLLSRHLFCKSKFCIPSPLVV